MGWATRGMRCLASRCRPEPVGHALIRNSLQIWTEFPSCEVQCIASWRLDAISRWQMTARSATAGAQDPARSAATALVRRQTPAITFSWRLAPMAAVPISRNSGTGLVAKFENQDVVRWPRPVMPTSPIILPISTCSPKYTKTLDRCRYIVSYPWEWAIFIMLPSPPLRPANSTRPAPMVCTGVPIGAP